MSSEEVHGVRKPSRISNKAQRKLSKVGADTIDVKVENNEWNCCCLWLERKRRFCGQRRKSESQFCGLHHHEIFGADQRIPCPLDATHSINKDLVEAHVRICQKGKTEKEMIEQAFYRRNINSGPPENSYSEHVNDSILRPMARASGDKGGGQYLSEFIDRIDRIYNENITTIMLEELSPIECEPLKEAAESVNMEFKKSRHLIQQASIIGHMQKRGLVSVQNCYIEMGAGRGLLGVALAKTFPDIDLIMVDGSKPRNAGDKTLKDMGKPAFRAKIDIRDLDAANLPLPDSKKVVFVAKHLCGVGTDLALRCILTLAKDHSRDSVLKENNKNFALENGISGVAIATCCHHCANLQDYVGGSFARKCGLSAYDFSILGRLGGWATLSSDDPREHSQVEALDGPKLSPLRRIEIGQRAKRLIDWGRKLYLEELGFQAELVYFCSTSVTPENCLLIAWLPM